jgi:plastocyanin domain-containing protein
MTPLFQRLLVATSLTLLGGSALALPADARAEGSHQETREIEIVVRRGYDPRRIEVVQGETVRLRFVRQESADCSREVVFPALGIRKELPEGKPVVIQLPELAPGEYEFKCGMDMIRGKLIVRPKG